jgi:hypothetical protein
VASRSSSQKTPTSHWLLNSQLSMCTMVYIQPFIWKHCSTDSLDIIYSEISKVLVELKLRGGELYKYLEEKEKIIWENMRIP